MIARHRSLSLTALTGLITALAPVGAEAAVSLTNGSFETTGATYLSALGGLMEATGWTNLTGNTGVLFQASSAIASNPPNPEFTGGTPTGTRYLRLAADPGGSAIWGAVAQNMGTMVTGETYTVLADVFGGPGDGGQLYGAKVSLVDSVSATPATTYASQTVDGVTNAAFLANGINFSYTATASDNGKPLVILLQALDNGASNQSRRGGLDNLRVNTVPEPSVAILGLLGAVGLVRRRR